MNPESQKKKMKENSLQIKSVFSGRKIKLPSIDRQTICRKYKQTVLSNEFRYYWPIEIVAVGFIICICVCICIWMLIFLILPLFTIKFFIVVIAVVRCLINIYFCCFTFNIKLKYTRKGIVSIPPIFEEAFKEGIFVSFKNALIFYRMVRVHIGFSFHVCIQYASNVTIH